MPRSSLQSGKLRHRITILDRVDGAGDGSGGRNVTYVPLAPDRWCSIRPATETEVFNAGRINNVISHILKFRFSSDLHPDNRLLFKGRTFRIVSVLDVDEQRFVMMVKANEIVVNP